MNPPPPPPTGPVPARLRVFAVAIILFALGMGYFFLYQPLAEARRTGTLTYYEKGVFLSPAFLYMGVVMLFADVRNGQILELRPNGKKYLTGKGWSFVVGLIAIVSLTFAAWSLTLRHLGFQSF